MNSLRKYCLLACLAGVVCSNLVRAGNSKTVEFSEPYSQFVYAGGGEVVALHFPARGEVSAFDTSSGERLFTINDVGASDIIAGARERIVVISPEKMLARTYALKTGKRLKLAVLKLDDSPKLAFMGYDSNGPLLVVTKSNASLLNLESLAPIDVKSDLLDGIRGDNVSIQTASNGRSFGVIPTGYGPVSFSAIHLADGSLRRVLCGSTSNAIRWMQPTANGSLMLRPGGTIYDGNGREIVLKEFKDAALIPSTDASLFLDVRLDSHDTDDRPAAKLTVCSTANCSRLLSEIGFNELVPERMSSWHDIAGALRLGSQWRVHYVVTKNKLLTLPAGNKRLIVRDFHLQKKLRTADGKYLYVSSTPPLRATLGKSFDYRIRAKSNAKIVSTKLESGPGGAKLVDGRLKWEPPDDFTEPLVRFLVSIRNAEDNEFLHSFEVAIDHHE